MGSTGQEGQRKEVEIIVDGHIDNGRPGQGQGQGQFGTVGQRHGRMFKKSAMNFVAKFWMRIKPFEEELLPFLRDKRSGQQTGRIQISANFDRQVAAAGIDEGAEDVPSAQIEEGRGSQPATVEGRAEAQQRAALTHLLWYYLGALAPNTLSLSGLSLCVLKIGRAHV